MTALMGLDARMRMARLWWCTDGRAPSGAYERLVAEVLGGGVDVVQLRAPDLGAEEETSVLGSLRAAAASTQALVVAGGTPEVAGRAHADALLLADGLPAAAARPFVHRWAHLGRTVRDEAALDAALADSDVDFLVVPTAPEGEPADLDLVRYAGRQAPPADLEAKPWWAAGGIGPETIDAVVAAGACRVMVDEALTTAEDPRRAAETLRAQVSRPWHHPAMQRYLTGAAVGASSLVRG